MIRPENLQYREFWTPGECAAMLGRSPRYWIAAYEAGQIEGYRETRNRHIRASSARAHLDSLCAARPEPSGLDRARAKTRATMRAFRDQQQRLKASNGTLQASNHNPEQPTG